jgi:hypothetical protein
VCALSRLPGEKLSAWVVAHSPTEAKPGWGGFNDMTEAQAAEALAAADRVLFFGGSMQDVWRLWGRHLPQLPGKSGCWDVGLNAHGLQAGV